MTTKLSPAQYITAVAAASLPATATFLSSPETWAVGFVVVATAAAFAVTFAAAIWWSQSAMNAASAADEAVWDREMVIALSDTEKSGDRTPVKIRLLNPLASVPQNAKQGDAGFDLRSVVDVTVPAGGTLVIPTGVAIEIPSDTVALVCSRSGMAAKQSVAVLNAPGVIDSGYRGELLVVLHNHGSEPFPVSVGDRIAQLMIQHYLVPHFELVDELGESERGTAGKGSTGLA